MRQLLRLASGEQSTLRGIQDDGRRRSGNWNRLWLLVGRRRFRAGGNRKNKDRNELTHEGSCTGI